MSMSAVMSFLANAPDREVAEILSRGPEKAAEFLRAEWVLPDRNLSPDSAEAGEAAAADEKAASGARRVWRRVLNPKQRTALLATARLLGVSPAEVRTSLD